MDNARELASRLLDLLRREQAAMADFLVALAAFDERRLLGRVHTGHPELGLLVAA